MDTKCGLALIYAITLKIQNEKPCNKFHYTVIVLLHTTSHDYEGSTG